jgi:hypothetical protein
MDLYLIGERLGLPAAKTDMAALGAMLAFFSVIAYFNNPADQALTVAGMLLLPAIALLAPPVTDVILQSLPSPASTHPDTGGDTP